MKTKARSDVLDADPYERVAKVEPPLRFADGDGSAGVSDGSVDGDEDYKTSVWKWSAGFEW